MPLTNDDTQTSGTPSEQASREQAPHEQNRETGGWSRWTSPRAAESAGEVARYSRFVSWMKLILPTTALAILGAIIVYSKLYDPGGDISVTFSEIAAEDDDLRMVSPRFTGVDSHDRAYTVTANSATQRKGNTEFIDLYAIEARMELENGKTVQVTARNGTINTKSEELELNRDIVVADSRGYTLYAERALINLKEGTLVSNQPVNGNGPLGELEANGMEVAEKGRIIRFKGGVKLTNKQERLDG